MNLLWQSLFTIAFGAACWAVGDVLLKRLLQEDIALPGIAGPVLAFAAGNVLLSYLLTFLGFIGGFISLVFWVASLAGGVLAVWRMRVSHRSRFSDPPRPVFAEASRWGRRDDLWACAFLFAVAGFFLTVSILQAAAPPYVRDTLVYHLLCPKEYLKAGHLVHIDGNFYSAFPKGQEVLMTLLLALGGDRAAQGFSVLQQFAAVGGLLSLVRMVAGPWTSALCTLGIATVPPVIYFTGCGYVEPALLMTFVCVLLALALLQGISQNTSLHEGSLLKGVALAGLLSGWMVALKYNGLIYLGLIGLVLLWRQRKTPPLKVLSIVGTFSLFAAPGFCWMVWSWITLNNPVYPMAWFLFGGKGWDATRAVSLSGYFDLFGMGRQFSDYVKLPWRFAFDGRFDSLQFDGAMGPFLIVFFMLALISLASRMRHRQRGDLLSEWGFMLLISAAFFIFGTQQARFWLPSQALLCAYSAPAVESLLTRARTNQGLRIILGLVLAASLLWNAWYLGRQVLAVGYYRPVFGMEQERMFLNRKVAGYPAIEFVNRLPEKTRTLCVWTGAYGYYIDRPYYSDTFTEDVMLDRWMDGSANGQELAEKLLRAGFTHLFINLSLLERNLRAGQLDLLKDFFSSAALPLFRHKDYCVFEIRK